MGIVAAGGSKPATCEICNLCDGDGANRVDHLVALSDGRNLRPDQPRCHPDCHDRKHHDPDWARERVEMALEVLER